MRQELSARNASSQTCASTVHQRIKSNFSFLMQREQSRMNSLKKASRNSYEKSRRLNQHLFSLLVTRPCGRFTELMESQSGVARCSVMGKPCSCQLTTLPIYFVSGKFDVSQFTTLNELKSPEKVVI